MDRDEITKVAGVADTDSVTTRDKSKPLELAKSGDSPHEQRLQIPTREEAKYLQSRIHRPTLIRPGGWFGLIPISTLIFVL